MSGFFEKFNNEVVSKIEEMTKPLQSQFGQDMLSLLSAGISVYILWVGYQTLAGKRQTPLPDLAWDLAKFGIILTFVSNADGYLTAAMDAIKSMKDGFLGKPVWATLDTMWSTTQLLADKVYAMDKSTYVSVEGGIGSMLVWGGSILIMAVAAVIYMLADVTMQLAVLVAPIFIGCYMFGFTRVMFNNWLGILFSSVLTVIFAGVLVKIGTDFQTDMISQISKDANSTNILTMGAMAFVIGVLVAVFVWKSSSIAQQLAGAGVEGALQGAAMFTGLAGAAAGTKAISAAGSAGIGLGVGLAGRKGMQSLSGKAGNLLGRGTRTAAEWAGDRSYQKLAPTGAVGMAARRLASLEKARARSAI